MGYCNNKQSSHGFPIKHLRFAAGFGHCINIMLLTLPFSQFHASLVYSVRALQNTFLSVFLNSGCTALYTMQDYPSQALVAFDRLPISERTGSLNQSQMEIQKSQRAKGHLQLGRSLADILMSSSVPFLCITRSMAASRIVSPSVAVP